MVKVNSFNDKTFILRLLLGWEIAVKKLPHPTDDLFRLKERKT